MATHRYEPVSASDIDDIFPLKDLPESNATLSYFSGVPTSAPPSFRSRSDSISEVEQPVPFGDVIPGSVNSTNSAEPVWTPSTNTNKDEVIGALLARIERLEADVRAKHCMEEYASEAGDSVNWAMSRKQKKDRCCNQNVVAIIFGMGSLSILIIMMAVVALQWVEAWGKKNNCPASGN